MNSQVFVLGLRLQTHLDEERVSEAQRALQVLAERVVEEARLADLLVAVLVHDEVGRLTRRVNDERVAVEALQHDGVLRAQVVRRKRVRLPAHALIRRRQVLKATSARLKQKSP